MIALLTSCGRHDLLEKTLMSFYKNQKYKWLENILVQDNSDESTPDFIDDKNFNNSSGDWKWTEFTRLNGEYVKGQHGNIEYFIEYYQDKDKYCLFLEDDWFFENTYDWIHASIDIMEADPSVIKVLARKDSPHPMEMFGGKVKCNDYIERGFYYLQPWTGADNIKWHGFSWNPGVTRLDLLKQFVPFPKWEQELAENIYNAGYKTVALENGIYTHIGGGRSTHE